MISGRSLSVRKSDQWQDEVWSFYDEVGELRYAITFLANALSRVQLVAATPTNDEPERQNEGRAAEIVASLGGGPTGQSQILWAFGIHLGVPGIGYLIGETDPETNVESWRVYAADCLRQPKGNDGAEYEVQDAETGAWRSLAPETLVVQCWRPHPRRPWEPDSPTRACLPALRELDLLNKRIAADAMSRLAGAGILIVPNEAVFEKKRPDDPNEDPFTEDLVVSMTTPIGDRESAAAVVPLVVKVPGEYADKFIHLRLSTDFDARLLEMRDSAVRRLAIGLDLPSEVLLGLSDVNHWSAWQIEESAIKLHIEPAMEVIVEALTEGYLKPALAAEGGDPDSAIVWFDTSDLRQRPDHSADAVAAYDRGQVGGETLRRETGFGEGDMPTDDELRRQAIIHTVMTNPAALRDVIAALDVMTGKAAEMPPAPAQPAPGLPPAPAEPDPAQGPPNGGTPPADTPEPPAAAATAAAAHAPWPDALLEACHATVLRALERAGNKLRGRAGMTGTDCAPVDAHTCVSPETMRGADYDALLKGAWDGIPEIAARYRMEPDALTRFLDSYTRGLLVGRTAHSFARLSDTLGYRAEVSAA